MVVIGWQSDRAAVPFLAIALARFHPGSDCDPQQGTTLDPQHGFHFDSHQPLHVDPCRMAPSAIPNVNGPYAGASCEPVFRRVQTSMLIPSVALISNPSVRTQF